MISKLKGLIEEIFSDAMVLDVGGVGYQMTCSSRTLSQLPPVGSYCTMVTEMVVREDAMTLYGFIDTDEKQWFRLLTTVQGVGSRVALSLLSLSESDQLAYAINTQDTAFISRADGVGPKLAARIVTELKDKVIKMNLIRSSAKLSVLHSPSVATGSVEDAIATLTALGYKLFEAQAAIQSVLPGNDEPVSTSDLIRLSLTKLGRK